MIVRFQARQARRRRLRRLLTFLLVAAVVAAVATVAVLVAQSNGRQTTDGSTATLVSGPGTGGGDTTTTSEADPTDGSGQSPGPGTGSSQTSVAPTTTSGSDSTSSTSSPATTSSSTSTSSTSSSTATTAGPAQGYVVVIDPGHQAKANSDLEPVGPGSSDLKAKVSSGTASVNTGKPESELVLTIGLKLRDALAAQGVKVIMTRTTQDVNVSNVERAQIANQAGADLFVRVHADGNNDSAVNGIHVLYPASISGWTDDIAAVSKKAAAIAQRELIGATGAKDRGIDARNDMTGFNWADVPVILPEIGFMTNPAEDKLLATGSYQDKIVQALSQAIMEFLKSS